MLCFLLSLYRKYGVDQARYKFDDVKTGRRNSSCSMWSTPVGEQNSLTHVEIERVQCSK